MKVVLIIITSTFVCHSCKNTSPDNMAATCHSLPESVKITTDKDTKETTIQIHPGTTWALYANPSPDALDTMPRPTYQGDSTPATLHARTLERMYYKLVTPTSAHLFAERHLPMSGGYNFRDLGGIRTRDDRYVRWGKLFRADDLHHLTEADLHYLSSIPVVSVVDFRSQQEIDNAPDKLPASVRDTFDLTIEPGNVRSLMNFSDLDAGRLDSLMTGIYVNLVTDPAFIARYRAFFQLLQDTTRAPLLFHCSAGKDRTGVAAALILYALGVDEATVTRDYLASNAYLGNKYAGELEKHPALRSVLTVKREFLQAAIDRVKQDHGSVERFLEHELNVNLPEFKKAYLY